MTREEQIEAALRKFEMHYPQGINPWLDDAWRDARAALAAPPTPSVAHLVETAQWARNRLESIADAAWHGDGRDFKRALVGVFADFDAALAACGSVIPAEIVSSTKPAPPTPSVAGWEAGPETLDLLAFHLRNMADSMPMDQIDADRISRAAEILDKLRAPSAPAPEASHE